jgi:hypothetical protein
MYEAFFFHLITHDDRAQPLADAVSLANKGGNR